MFKKFSTPPSVDKTREYYDRLMADEVSHIVWGKASRFDAKSIAEKQSVKKYFLSEIEPYLDKDKRVLDLGCGVGGFSLAIAPLCGELVGADISPAFYEAYGRMIKENGLNNTKAVLVEDESLPFPDESFDVLLMVDTIHHMSDPRKTLSEARRVLRKGGHFLIFEPNKLNPLLWFLCLLDPNERGLLSLGTKKAYTRLLDEGWDVSCASFNGLLVGPDSSMSLAIADILSSRAGRYLLGWLSPKIFMVARRVR